MSSYQQRPGDISVFKEKTKTNPKAPDWRGTYTDQDGIKWEVSFWEKSGTMLAGSIKPAFVKRVPTSQNDDSEIPF